MYIINILLTLLLIITATSAAPEQGKFFTTIANEHTFFFVKTLYNESEITIRVEPDTANCDDDASTFYIQWMVRGSTCYGEYSGLENEDVSHQDRVRSYMYLPPQQIERGGMGKWIANYKDIDETEGGGDKIHCDDNGIILAHPDGPWRELEPLVSPNTGTTAPEEKSDAESDNTKQADEPGDEAQPVAENKAEPGSENADKEDGAGPASESENKPVNAESENKPVSEAESENKPVSGVESESPDKPVNDAAPVKSEKAQPPPTEPKADAGTENAKPPSSRKKRADDSKDDANTVVITTVKPSASKPANAIKSKGHVVAITPEQNAYIVIIHIRRPQAMNSNKGSFNVTVEMKTPKGYLSAHEYPFLTFYMIMCIIYVFYAVAWLILAACNYKDLLRVQFWIGAVILLGMIEKAVFYSDYLNVNTTGISVIGAAKFAEIVSALKRSLARMLCIIVSLGFGIVKPRLGPMLHRVIGVGALYFVLAVVEALVRQDSDLHEPENTNLLLTFIPLSILDAVICWWVFISLMQTMKTLRLRRNVVKLSLYRHFSNAIIFSVVASLIMIFWTFRLHKDSCLNDWSELWIEQAFWHVLFSVVLLVIIILWRPNANNQRYAFSPLIDGGDSDEEGLSEQLLGSGATETMKMRGMKMETNGKNAADKAEDDLKWIEENIPQTVADAALPALLDSDEEIMTTKYEMSKME